MISKKLCKDMVWQYGNDILNSEYIQIQKQYIQHGNTSIFEHCFNVACLSLYIANLLKIKTDEKALIRGALLHDYFLYDWHVSDTHHRLHGFTHAKCALRNAERDFIINNIERNIIERHMFPLNIKPPSCRESIIVCIADKISSLAETFYIK